MTKHTYVLTFTPRREFDADDRRHVKDMLGDVIRLVAEDSTVVAIDQHTGKDQATSGSPREATSSP